MTSLYSLCPSWFALQAQPWNAGITGYAYRTEAPTGDIVDIGYLAKQVLRVASGSVEYDHITELMATATEMAELYEGVAYQSQTMRQVMSGFPASGRIELARRPVISIDSFTYLDADGVEQTLSGSPASYRLVSYGDAARAVLTPLAGESFPVAGDYLDAVTIEFTAGYEDPDQIPRRKIEGIAVVVGEMYKQRTFSVQGLISTPSVLKFERFFENGYPLGGIW